MVLGPLVALAILAVIGLQTSEALRHSGTWSTKSRPAQVAVPDPYARLEAQLAAPAKAQALADLRDPFAYSRPAVPVRRAPERPRVPPPPPKPVLTAILSDNAPRAFIRYQDRNYTVKVDDMFADFRVVSITADHVVLDRSGEHIILYRPTKGD